jgi:molecular chaperone GrpE
MTGLIEAADQAVATATAEELQTALTDCQQALQATRQESADRWDALLRAQAELDNERKRAAREIEKAHKFAVDQLLLALLPVKDSLELGLITAGHSPNPQSLRHGMQLTLEQLGAVLADFGVESIDPQGQPFNPEYHEAVNMEPVADMPPNTVYQVQQKGYLLNGRVVRPARVTVSRMPQDTEE